MKSDIAVRACLLGVLAVIGAIASSSTARAADISILLVPARDAALQVRIWKLEQAIRDSHRQLAVAETLADAHVIVQFTDYRRSTGAKGVPVSHWVGQARLLRQPEAMTISATPLPERFELLAIGEDGSDSQRALKALELLLSKTLRPRRPRVEKDVT
jgi:hypothetical protein